MPAVVDQLGKLSRLYGFEISLPGDHQGTFQSPQFDRCNWTGCTGDLSPVLHPFRTAVSGLHQTQA